MLAGGLIEYKHRVPPSLGHWALLKRCYEELLTFLTVNESLRKKQNWPPFFLEFLRSQKQKEDIRANVLRGIKIAKILMNLLFTDLLYHQSPKMLPREQGEDTENLFCLERMSPYWGWPPSDWACRFLPLLRGKALEAFLTRDEQASNSYWAPKDAFMAKFD